MNTIRCPYLEDNPLLRHQSTIMDLYSGTKIGRQLPGELRLIALERTREINSKISGPPIPGASNWVQMGPTAVPHGQTVSSYYGEKNNQQMLAKGPSRNYAHASDTLLSELDLVIFYSHTVNFTTLILD